MSDESTQWAQRNWWDPAGDHFGSTDHETPAAYLSDPTGLMGPLSPDDPPAGGEVYFSEHTSVGRHVLLAVAKLGVAERGEVLRQWAVDPTLTWWSTSQDRRAVDFYVFIADRFGGSWFGDWFRLQAGPPADAARDEACRISRLTDAKVVWTQVLGVLDMF